MASQKVTRIGDQGVGICTLHGDVPVNYTTIFNTGSPTTNADGKPILRIGDHGLASCGHTTTALTGSGVYFADGIAVHRVGDTGTTGGGSYTVTTGSPNVDSA